MVYDVAGIGIGPFNLGLSSLLETVPSVKKVFFDQKSEFAWHKGIMPNWSTLQIPFIADLVTLVDPTSDFSYLNYLKVHGRLHRFYIYENFYISREDYNAYCKWVCKQQKDLVFGKRVETVVYNQKTELYRLEIRDLGNHSLDQVYAKKLVLGTGTQPVRPSFYQENDPRHCLINDYSYQKEELKNNEIITVVGSGQSGAEAFFDLLLELKDSSYCLQWIGRTKHFMAMDLNKLALEVTTPDYAHFFYDLPHEHKQDLVVAQRALYKGVNFKLLNAIYDYLYEHYHLCEGRVRIFPSLELLDSRETEKGWQLQARSTSSGKTIELETQALIFALGFCYEEPDFMKNLDDVLRRNADGELVVSEKFTIDKRNTIFVQNVGLSQHGIVTPDLSVGPFRNAMIVNELLGQEFYVPDRHFTFQKFV
ncbi:L-lysine N6-monooxygenase [Oligella sp. MSHR50489EDL]|uniref:lysine N(6)-hydroxylase/L-ornithine N(5)-oxygenase family protein n=1 Tax=Oligella sp. MSHR50489EDL TaxID=3139409 RepID=UPI003D819D03